MSIPRRTARRLVELSQPRGLAARRKHWATFAMKVLRRRAAPVGLIVPLCAASFACSSAEQAVPSQYGVYAAILSDYEGKRVPMAICRYTTVDVFSRVYEYQGSPQRPEPRDPKSRTELGEGEGASPPGGRWTISNSNKERLQEVFPQLDNSTLEAFWEANDGPHLLDPEGLTEAIGPADLSPCVTPTEGRIKQLVELSAVGLGHDQRQALVYMGILEPQAGRGWYILLERHGPGWVEVARVQAWIA